MRTTPVASGGGHGAAPSAKVPRLSFVLLLFRILKQYGAPSAIQLTPPK